MRYYIHVLLETGELVRDQEGESKTDDAEAMSEGYEVARDLVRHVRIGGFCEVPAIQEVIVEDESGRRIGSVSLAQTRQHGIGQVLLQPK